MTENLELARLFQERVHTYHEAGLLHEGSHLKEDWITFSYLLSTLPIKELFHITTCYDVRSIFEHGGLVSRSNQQKAGITPHFSLGNATNFVSLSFCPANNILNEIKQSKWQAVQLTIDPIAVLLKGTEFHYWDNATQQYFKGETTEELLQINFDEELQALSQDQQKRETPAEIKAKLKSNYRNAVILVPNKVPSFLIRDIKLV